MLPTLKLDRIPYQVHTTSEKIREDDSYLVQTVPDTSSRGKIGLCLLLRILQISNKNQIGQKQNQQQQTLNDQIRVRKVLSRCRGLRTALLAMFFHQKCVEMKEGFQKMFSRQRQASRGLEQQQSKKTSRLGWRLYFRAKDGDDQGFALEGLRLVKR